MDQLHIGLALRPWWVSQVEGREVDTLANSGSQVNTVMLDHVCQHEFPVLLLHDLVDHPLNLVGLGGMRTRLLGFVILRVWVNEITGYVEDVVFLVVPDELGVLGMEDKWEPLSVAEQQKKLLEKLNLDGLSNWTPWNAMAAWDLMLAFHDIFTLEGSELGCTNAVKHEIRITDSEPFKEQFRHIPPLLLEEMHASLCDMLVQG